MIYDQLLPVTMQLHALFLKMASNGRDAQNAELPSPTGMSFLPFKQQLFISVVPY